MADQTNSRKRKKSFPDGLVALAESDDFPILKLFGMFVLRKELTDEASKCPRARRAYDECTGGLRLTRSAFKNIFNKQGFLQLHWPDREVVKAGSYTVYGVGSFGTEDSYAYFPPTPDGAQGPGLIDWPATLHNGGKAFKAANEAGAKLRAVAPPNDAEMAAIRVLCSSDPLPPLPAASSAGESPPSPAAAALAAASANVENIASSTGRADGAEQMGASLGGGGSGSGSYAGLRTNSMPGTHSNIGDFGTDDVAAAAAAASTSGNGNGNHASHGGLGELLLWDLGSTMTTPTSTRTGTRKRASSFDVSPSNMLSSTNSFDGLLSSLSPSPSPSPSPKKLCFSDRNGACTGGTPSHSSVLFPGAEGRGNAGHATKQAHVHSGGTGTGMGTNQKPLQRTQHQQGPGDTGISGEATGTGGSASAGNAVTRGGAGAGAAMRTTQKKKKPAALGEAFGNLSGLSEDIVGVVLSSLDLTSTKAFAFLTCKTIKKTVEEDASKVLDEVAWKGLCVKIIGEERRKSIEKRLQRQEKDHSNKAIYLTYATMWDILTIQSS